MIKSCKITEDFLRKHFKKQGWDWDLMKDRMARKECGLCGKKMKKITEYEYAFTCKCVKKDTRMSCG